MASEEGDRSDSEEMGEIIKEFLYPLDWAYHYRLQKLIFYGEVWCLQTYGKRLTDADFLAHHHGSFSRDIEDALENLRESGEVDFERELKDDGPTYRYLHHEDGGEISPAKKEIVRYIHQETASWTTEKLAQFSKQTWLYKNAELEESMDFETYRDEIIIPTEERERVADQVGNPSSDDAPIEELLEH
jgi:uncharacterized phage-associated protein